MRNLPSSNSSPSTRAPFSTQDTPLGLLFPGPGGLAVGFGTWALDGAQWGPIDTGSAKRVLKRAWERGFRHFDTAESYGSGRSEQLIGQGLRREIRQHRDSVQIASKSVVRPPTSLRTHVERSLRRMQCEYIDLFYIHWPRQGLDLRAAVEALDTLRSRGMIRAIGLSNVSVEEYRSAAGAGPIAAVQFGYNLIWRRPERQGLTEIPTARIAYSPLAQGVLARRFSRNPAEHPDDHRRQTPLFAPGTWPAVHQFNNTVLDTCSEIGANPAAVALYWAATRLDGAIVGGRTPEQIDVLAEGVRRLLQEVDRYVPLFSSLLAASDRLQTALPELPNMFGYVPTPCRRC